MGSACLEVLAGEQTMKFQVLLCVLPSTMSATLKHILPNYPYQGILPLAPYPYAFNPFSFPLANTNNENPSSPKSSIPFPFYPFPNSFLLPQNGGYVHDSTVMCSCPTPMTRQETPTCPTPMTPREMGRSM